MRCPFPMASAQSTLLDAGAWTLFLGVGVVGVAVSINATRRSHVWARTRMSRIAASIFAGAIGFLSLCGFWIPFGLCLMVMGRRAATDSAS